MMNSVRVLIINDNMVIRTGLRALLEGVNGITVIGEVPTVDDAIAWMNKSSAHVVLLDIQLPGMDGIKATSKMVRRRLETKVLALTAMEDPYILAQSILAGASGCLTYKRSSSDKVVLAIRSLTSGHPINVPQPVKHALDNMSQTPEPTQASKTAKGLTKREKDIFDLLAIGRTTPGKPNGEKHLCNIYAKLNISSRYEAMSMKLRELL